MQETTKWIFHRIFTIGMDNSDRKHASTYEKADYHIMIHDLWLK